MTSEWVLAAVIVGVVLLLLGAVCVLILIRMEGSTARREAALQQHVDRLDEALRMLEARLGQMTAPEAGTEITESEELSGEQIDEEIAPEIQAAIAAAAVAAAGPNARVRSAKEVNGMSGASAWSQQGRMLVQGSHNLRPRR